MTDRRPALPARRYRWLDRGTKLLGVVLVAGGLAVGGHTVAGVALAAVGTGLGLLTVFVTTADGSPAEGSAGGTDQHTSADRPATGADHRPTTDDSSTPR